MELKKQTILISCTALLIGVISAISAMKPQEEAATKKIILRNLATPVTLWSDNLLTEVKSAVKKYAGAFKKAGKKYKEELEKKETAYLAYKQEKTRVTEQLEKAKNQVAELTNDKNKYAKQIKGLSALTASKDKVIGELEKQLKKLLDTAKLFKQASEARRQSIIETIENLNKIIKSLSTEKDPVLDNLKEVLQNSITILTPLTNPDVQHQSKA